MTEQVKDFHDCLKESRDKSKRSILLGNGFSMEINNTAFSYSALQKEALTNLETPHKEKLEKLFTETNTQDFEIVLKKIKDALEIISIVCRPNEPAVQDLQETYKLVKECLIKTISKCHPDTPNKINDRQYKACQKFIENFSTIYTINYDLTLYWALMHNYDKEKNNFIDNYSDGFTSPPNDDEDYVVWDIKRGQTPKLIYLHGALHIFDDNGIIKKFTWIRSGKTLKEQITKQLENNIFPIFISEGTKKDKEARINRSSILSKGYRSLSQKKGDLFTFGISFSDNDDHLLDAIFNPGFCFENLFVGIHGTKIKNDLSEKLKNFSKKFNEQCNGKKQAPKIHYYDTCTAKAWG